MPKKIIVKLKKFLVLYFTFALYALSLAFISNVYALNLDNLKISFLSGDYKSAITEGERLVAQNIHTAVSDELYYFLGVSYLKDGNYLRAADIFEIILKEFKNSAFKEEAKLGLGDAYFVSGDYTRAQDYYRQLKEGHPNTKYLPLAYHRLSLCAAKLGNTAQAQEYLHKLHQEFPSTIEIKNCEVPAQADNFYYTVQTGSFSNNKNARKLSQELNQKGYSVFIEEVNLDNRTVYRVKVGKFSTRQEAETAKDRLSQEGYPTRICP